MPADASLKSAPAPAPVPSSPKQPGDSSSKVVVSSPKKVPAAELPRAALSPKASKASSPSHGHYEDHGDDSKPSAAELARRRAERFGIPVHPDEKADQKMVEEEAAHADAPKDSGPNEMEKYRHIFEVPEGSILTTDDFVSDGRSSRLVALVIEQSGEEKVREILNGILSKTSADFENDRSKIQSAPRLASFRLSRALKSALPKPEKPERVKKDIAKKETNKKEDKKDDRKKKWTDEEWAEWKKNKEGNQKKDWNDWKKGSGEWKSNDWNSNKKGDGKGGKKLDSHKRSDSYDTFESDVEEFIYSNRLDKRSAEALRTESKGMVGYVMDQGFNLNRYNNPSKEVMMRMKEYVNKKRGYGNNRGGASRSDYPQKSRSRSRSRTGGRQAERSASRGRSRSRSDSRDQYRRSRSQSM